MDDLLFKIAIDNVLNEKIVNGIGTYKEKTLHRVIKRYISSDLRCHEVKIDKCIVDVYDNDMIYEIQTANFNKLRNKLDRLLENHIITIVFPIAHIKYLLWIDNETGEVSKKRKSPKIGSIYNVIKELYKIKMYLNHPNIRLKLLLIDMDEYRKKDGWGNNGKKGSHREERIPFNLFDEIDLVSKLDYLQFIPEKLDEFTTKDLSLSCHISLKISQVMVNIFKNMGIIYEIGKTGNLIKYKKV